ESEVNFSLSSSAQSKKHDNKTKREAKGKSPVESLTRYRNLSAEFEDFSNNSINEDNAAGTLVPAVGQLFPSNTNTFSAAGPSNAVASPTHGKSSYVDSSQLLDDPNMLELEDITYFDDEDDVGAEADCNNLETSITVSPILTTRVHKDHHVTQIISDISSATQTRSVTRVAKDQGFEDPDYPDKVYKVVKALYGLHQAPRAWYEALANYLLENVKQKKDGIFISQDKYVAKILRKFGLTYEKSASTPIDTEKSLLKDLDGEDVDVHTYISMIGSLMYLTSSRPDIMFAVCGRMIANMDADVDVTLKDVAVVVKDVQDAEIKESSDVQGRQAESQAQIYQIDLEHADKVLSMQDVDIESAELQKVVEVVTTAKLITEVVIAASATITTVAPTLTIAPSAVRRRNKVVIRDPKETATPSTIIHTEPKSKDKGKGIMVEEPKPLKKQAQIEQDKAYARELEAELNKNIDWDEVIDHVQRKEKEDNAVKRYQALKRKPQTEAQARKNMMIYLRNIAGFKMDYFKGMTYDDIRLIFKKKFNSDKLDEEVEEVRKHPMIVPNEDDDVYTEATPLACKVSVVDYEIYTENNKPYYKIKRADGSHQLYLSFLSMLRNFDREDLEIITFTKTQLILLVERKYPLTRFTLDQMLNNVRLEVEEASDVSLELLRKQKEDNAVKRYQALKRKPQTKVQARKTMMIYIRNVARFKMDYFKGMNYNDICPIFEKKFNSNVAFLLKTKEQMDEEDSRALKRLSESQEDESSKKRKNFDREDLEVLSRLVKERFASTKPKNFSDDFLLTTLGAMFEKPNDKLKSGKIKEVFMVKEEISTYKVHSGSDAQ
nr:hypothetical protein [Tanacetum cinerariifolium]